MSTSTVVSLDAYRHRPTNSAVAQVEAYWTALCGTALMPARADVDPRGLTDVLDYTFMLERLARGLARFRVAGTHINALMGMEARGVPLTAMVLPESRETVGDALQAVFDEPATARMTLSSPGGLGRPALEAQLLILPLRSDLGEVSRALGCLVASGEPGRTPRRFGVTDQSRRTLIGYADPRTAPPSEPPAPAAGASHLTLVTRDS